MKQTASQHCCNQKNCPRCHCPVDKLTLVCPRCREPIPGGCTGSCLKCSLAKAKH